MNSHEMLNRQKKAEAILSALRRAGVTLAEALGAKEEHWIMAARLATQFERERTGDARLVVNPPKFVNGKSVTVEVILELMKREEQEVQRSKSNSNQSGEGEFGLPFQNYKTAQEEADEAEAEDRKAENKWEESQEYAGNRCPPRE
jgi:Tat protein secretion system quality control protein TatD with DNase activity